MSRAIIAHHLFDFAPVLSGWNKISVSAGPNGDLVILASRQDLDYRKYEHAAAQLLRGQPKNFRVYHLMERGWDVLDLQETRHKLHYIQPLFQDQWVGVRVRSAGNADDNGHIYSARGDLVRAVAFGDGIQDIQTTADGQIWVSYFDEGIFGDTTFGRTGLACFDQNDLITFGFNGMKQGSIASCYALNVVSNDEAWLCPYTNFQLVKVRNNQVDHFWDNNPIRGSRAFAISEERVLFSGGYSDKGKLFIVSLYRLDGQELLKEECHAVDENGEEVKFTNAFGRGSRLYLETDQSLYVLELQET